MKQLIPRAIIMVLFLIIVAACGQISLGPQAWLDHPLNNTSIPIAPLIIMAHASDADGVAKFEFAVNDTSVATVDAGGSRLGSAAFEWTPPGPGTYTIRVRAVDNGGNVGADATAVVTVGGDIIELPPSATPTPAIGITQGPTTLPSETAIPNTATPLQHTATTVPNTATPLPTVVPPTLTPSPIPDTSPPIFYFAEAYPDEILTDGGGCPTYPRTTNVSADVWDDTGIDYIYANWSIGAESGGVYLVFNGTLYEGVVGPVNTVGDIYIMIDTYDLAGNYAQAGPYYVNVQNCIS